MLLWEQRHGRPVPDGHLVLFADGDRRNFDPANLLLVSRAELAVMNKRRLAALLALNPNDIALFDTQRTPWETLQRCHAPLPECGADFTVALALAMREEPE